MGKRLEGIDSSSKAYTEILGSKLRVLAYQYAIQAGEFGLGRFDAYWIKWV